MTSSSSSATSSTPCEARPSFETESDKALKRNSNDIGREYGILANPSNLDWVKCKLCGKVMSGRVRIIKEHIGQIRGNVLPYTKALDDDIAKCKNANTEVKTKKRKLKRQEEELIATVNVKESETVYSRRRTERVIRRMKPPRSLGPMDKSSTTINPESSLNVAKTMREQNIHDALWKERSNIMKNYLADWIYEAGISFNAFDLDSFRLFTEALSQFGRRWKPPSQYELREPLLKKAVERIKGKVKPHEDEWGKNGCSLMTDAWSDRREEAS